MSDNRRNGPTTEGKGGCRQHKEKAAPDRRKGLAKEGGGGFRQRRKAVSDKAVRLGPTGVRQGQDD
jgi:hypothetical protein